MHVREVGLRDPRLRIERQPVAHGRIARRQVAAIVAQEPGAADPAARRAPARIVVRDRQHMADDRVEPLLEHAAHAVAFHRVVEPRIEGIDVDRQASLAPQVVPHVLVRRERVLRIEPEPLGDALQETLRVGLGGAAVLVLVGEPLRVRPHRLAVLAPVEVERPARQLLAGVPLALAVVQQAVGAVPGLESGEQLAGEQALLRAEGVGVPFGAVAIVDRNEGRLAALREAHVAALQVGVDLAAERLDARPLLFGVGLGDARRLPFPRDAHVVLEIRLALVDRAFDRRGRRRVGRACERDVAFAGEQSGGRVEPDPAGARQIDLAPRVQVGEIDFSARRAVERLHVGLQLNQVARDEARGEAEVAQQLHQQPAGVAA